VIFFRNEHTNSKSDHTKDRFDEELGCVFNKFLKCHMKILSDFSAKVGREDI
jgi:hypothetical protein